MFVSTMQSVLSVLVLLASSNSMPGCNGWAPTVPSSSLSLSTKHSLSSNFRSGHRCSSNRNEHLHHHHHQQHLTVLNKLNKADGMLDFIDEPLEPRYLVGDPPPKVPPHQDDLADLVRCIVRAADGRKADNIVALRVSPVSTVTSFVVIVTGNSRPQNQAIASAVKDDVQAQFGGMLPGSTGVPEGSADSGWTVLDYGSVMVHVMTPKSRLFYNVEGQWRDKGGEYMNLSDVLVPNTGVVVSSPSQTGQQQQQRQEQLQTLSVEVGGGEEKQVAGKVGRMEELSQEEDPFWS